MKFKNTKTCVVIETECEINGGDWKAIKAKKRKGTEADAEEDAGTEEGTETGNEEGGTEEGAGEDDKE